MSLYFFHLTFGDRISLDEEGVELPSRCAACEEAMAVVCELSDPALGGNPRRWASWFLQVADEHGAFLRAPIGYPALQPVAKDHEPVWWQVQSGVTLEVWPNSLRDRMAQALARSRRQRYELLCEYLTCEKSQRGTPARRSRRISSGRSAPQQSRRGGHLPISSCCRVGVDRNFSRCRGFGCQIDKRHLAGSIDAISHDLMVRRLAVSS